MVASTSETEVKGLFCYEKTAVSPRINLKELGFSLPPTPIETYNFAAEGIFAATGRQKHSNAMDMRFYWMKGWVKQKDFFV